jgi:hypothetical protein
MMPQDLAYETYLKSRAEDHEAACIRCGACCGALEADPCSHLVKGADGKYLCTTYENRLGLQKTVLGQEFRCVPVRNILFNSWAGSWKCAYKKQL